MNGRPRRVSAGSDLRLGPRLVLGAVLLLTGAAMAASAAHLWPLARANWLSMPALAKVRQWQRPGAKPPTPDVWLQTRAQLGQALAHAPENADLNEAMAHLYISAALLPQQAQLVRQAYLQASLGFLHKAQQARPMTSSTWANQALALHALDQMQPLTPDERQRLWRSFDRALAHGQRDNGVQQSLASVATARWDSLGPQRQQAMQQMLAQATPEQHRVLQLQGLLPERGMR